MATLEKSGAAREKKTRKNRSQKPEKVKLYREKEKRWVKDKNEIKKLEEDCSETINTSNLQRFLDFPISKRTFLGLKRAGYETPTEIQRESVVLALKGLDILGAAKTGSGKTLAFLIPILEILYRNEWTYLDGLGALIVTPVRELAYQIFEVLRKIGRLHEFSAGLIIGGKDLHFERSRIKSCNIIICTPGRLLQHMDENPLLDCSNIKVLVLDEADRMLDMGFAKTMNAIVENLPQKRQTLLFSATQTRSVKDLARLSLRDPIYVSVHEHSQHSTPESLQQSYIVCELHEKLNLLWSFIKHNLKQKILVFMTSCKQVKYAYEIFCRMRPGLSVMALYGSMHQLRRMSIYNDFCDKSHSVLIATDIAARGLDFPAVNWVVQLDCPEDANTYIHRAGRTARCETDGESLLVLLPAEEEAMVAQFAQKKIPITKIKVNPNRQHSIQRKLEAMLARDVTLKESAQRAFVTYIKSVFLMKDKKVFDVTKLDTDAYAHSLGLAIPPRIRFLQKHKKILEEKEAKKLAKSAKQLSKKVVNERVLRRKDEQASESSNSSSSDEETRKNEQKDFDLKKPSSKTASDFSAFCRNDSEGSGDDLFTVKRRIMPSEIAGDEDDATLDLQLNFSSAKKHSKPITKASIAKKMLKKKLKPNQKVIFDDDGEVVVDLPTRQMSEIAKEAAENESDGGINIEKAMAVMKEEDKIDKQLYRQKIKAKHKEKRLKEKERKNRHKAEMNKSDEEEDSQMSSSDEAASVDLDFLPDPDKIYGKANSDENESNPSDKESHASDSGQSESDGESDISANAAKIPDTRKRKLDPKAMARNKKMRVKDSVSTDAPLDTGLSLMDDEELAMHFLKHNS